MADKADVSYCYRNITNSDRPGHLEIITPPVFLGIVLFSSLTGLYLYEKRKSKKRSSAWCKQIELDRTRQQIEVDRTRQREADYQDDVFTVMLSDVDFLTDFDKEVLASMDSTFNCFSELVKILFPSMWAVILTSAFIGAHDSIFFCMYPYRAKPDINTGVTCFLAPAGLVFALTFGFVFQMVLEKHGAVKDKLVKEMSLLDQMITLTTNIHWANRVQIMVMLKAIKAELITTSMLVQRKEPSRFKAPAAKDIKVQIWRMVDVLQVASTHTEPGFPLNAILVDKLINYLLEINSICTDRMGALHTKIHPMKWAFLEFLASMSVFGVMIVHASSYRMELMMCELTVFSVCMLFYVLADFDSPFNGFFRVDVSILPEVVDRARGLYHNCLIDHRLEKLKNVGDYKQRGAFPLMH